MADQPIAAMLPLKIQHVIALRKALALAIIGPDSTIKLTQLEVVWLSQIEHMLWPGWKAPRPMPDIDHVRVSVDEHERTPEKPT